jgi:SAM-dependent methyltransferase
MPQCRECKMLKGDKCVAHEIAQVELKRPLPPPPTGACMIPIVHAYLEKIRAGHRVLEIGCGSWPLIKNHCEKVGAHYEGIDTQAEYFGIKNICTRIENLASLSYNDESFDFVIGNQTMEHWGEHGCSLEWGLYQCFRVCKTGGQVLLNIPFHFHGTKEFMLGKRKKLERLLKPFSTQVRFESWGNPTEPIPPYYPFPDFWRLRHQPAYVVDINCVKDRPLPQGYSNRKGYTGRMAQILRYPVSFNTYRVLRKLHFIRTSP